MKAILICFFAIVAFNSFGQYSPATHNQMHFQNRANGFITSLSPAPTVSNVNYFLYQEWNFADVYLKDSTKLIDLKVRMDMRANVIEIDHNNTIKILPVSKVLGLTLKRGNGIKEEFVNEYYVKGAEKAHYDRLLKIVYDGPVSLLCQIKPELIPAKSNPNPMIDIKKDEEVVFKKKYIITRGDDLIDASVGKSAFREEVIKVFGESAEPTVKKTSPKDEDDLISLVKELNQLQKS